MATNTKWNSVSCQYVKIIVWFLLIAFEDRYKLFVKRPLLKNFIALEEEYRLQKTFLELPNIEKQNSFTKIDFTVSEHMVHSRTARFPHCTKSFYKWFAKLSTYSKLFSFCNSSLCVHKFFFLLIFWAHFVVRHASIQFPPPPFESFSLNTIVRYHQ